MRRGGRGVLVTSVAVKEHTHSILQKRELISAYRSSRSESSMAGRGMVTSDKHGGQSRK